jgi:hypothetical protein
MLVQCTIHLSRTPAFHRHTSAVLGVPSLLQMLNVCRPGSGSSIAAMVTGSSSASLRPGSSGYNSREPAAAVLRQLGVAQVRAATAALTELQVGAASIASGGIMLHMP